MKISVIVPVYKVEKYIRQCVDSLIGQTWRDLEIILVDDGSPDTCPQICDEYAAKDERVKVIHQANSGQAKAREAGLLESIGEYVMFLDGDDWVDENTVESCVAAIHEETDTDCVVFSYIREYQRGSYAAHVLDRDCVLTGKKAEDQVYRRLFGLCGEELRQPERLESMGSCCMKVYRRDIALQGRFFDIKDVGSSEDTLFNIYALYGCRRIVYLDRPFYHYRKREDSSASHYRPRLMAQWGRLFELMETAIREKQLGSEYQQALDARIALSILGIGTNEMSAKDSFFAKARRVKTYIHTARYAAAVTKTDLSKMPLPWKTMLFFAKYRLNLMLCMELALIQFVRGRL